LSCVEKIIGIGAPKVLDRARRDEYCLDGVAVIYPALGLGIFKVSFFETIPAE
jgi:hypothetical protein